MRQLAGLEFRQDKAIQQYFIRAQELVTRLHQADEELPETLLNAMVLKGYELLWCRSRRVSNVKRYDREMMWRKISTLPCQRRMLLINLVYTLHSIHILGRLFLSLVVPKILDCVLYVTILNIQQLVVKKMDNAVWSVCKAKGHLASACKHWQRSPHKGLSSSLNAESSFDFFENWFISRLRQQVIYTSRIWSFLNLIRFEIVE